MHDGSTKKSAVSLHHSLKHDGTVYILRGHSANAVSVSTFEFFQVGTNPVAPQCFVYCCSLPRVRNKQLANKSFSIFQRRPYELAEGNVSLEDSLLCSFVANVRVL